MAPQPGIVEAFLAQLANMNRSEERAILPAYGTDREVPTAFVEIEFFKYIDWVNVRYLGLIFLESPPCGGRPSGKTGMGPRGAKPVCWSGPSNFLLGVWLDVVYCVVADNRGALDSPASPLEDRTVPYFVASVVFVS
jgi:hypothetical protein